MKKTGTTIAAIFFFCAAAFSKPETTIWSADKSHSSLKFSVTHMMMSEVEGKFKVYDGKVTSNNDEFSDATIEFTVDVNSINTDDEKRDGHLKSEEFFNTEKFPKMTFTSTSFKKVKGKKYVLVGNLTIKDVTQKVKFDVTFNGIGKNPWGMTIAAFKATSTIKRNDYNLKWNAALEAGGVLVSEEVAINLNMEFVKGK